MTYPEGHLLCYNYETGQKKDFGEVMGVAAVTLFKKKDLPNYDALKKGYGRSQQMWREETVARYKRSAIRQLKDAMKDLGSIKKAARACSMCSRQAIKLLGGEALKKPRKRIIRPVREESSFYIFLNISANIRSQLND